MISFDILDQFDGLINVFSTRSADGGASTGPFANLNLGNFQYDNRKNIEHNRSLFFERYRIDPQMVVYPQQIHSANVRLVQQPGIYPETDAIVTNRKNIYLSIQTADCFPVYLAEPAGNTIALIHAGWRGVVNNIIEKTIHLMTVRLAVDTEKIVAAIGPGLRSECFEVKSDVYTYFPKKFSTSHEESSKRYIDLAGIIKEKLIALGLLPGHIEESRLCSKCRDDLFFSYRRDGVKSGRMMGILGICS